MQKVLLIFLWPAALFLWLGSMSWASATGQVSPGWYISAMVASIALVIVHYWKGDFE